jgi:hypothetical protein
VAVQREVRAGAGRVPQDRGASKIRRRPVRAGASRGSA